ncbi:hypothetical protein P691DRAFT_665912 [Macrolepiota fuliginosa MF-IS2]|uniref:TRP C-terminal domain-containing protein n=1 Tax=Macrolepiota fuliginosa MF-IS2 TaxID=1400762 RepID=A0A9P6C6G9_9AGAR|nr:hypothetical protein P691DRAFT_665912 [Macrolepiota fuliginosa MF-IS2]
MRLLTSRLPPSLAALVLTLLLRYATPVYADPATVPFTDCFDDTADESQKLNVSTVYAQVLENHEWGKYLNLTVLGDSPLPIQGFVSGSESLSTLFTTTSVLTLNAWTNSSYLCNALRPPSPLPPLDNSSVSPTYCPIPAGPFAFSASVPWGRDRALTTLITRLRAVDPAGQELVCVDVTTTPLEPSEGEGPYGDARVILWASVALAAAYWAVVGVARVASAWGRGVNRSGRGVWGKVQSGGFILASAISGERLAASPALIRFCTPSMRDVIFHTQWCAALAMVAVQWPPFVYPLLTQTAWSTLSFNITLTDPLGLHRWNPLSTLPYSPPSTFSDQLADPSSPLYINPTIPNALFALPQNASDGIQSFAYAVGVRPQDLFPNCLILFLAIIGATIVLSLLLWALDYFMVVVVFKSTSRQNYATALSRTRSPAFGASVSSRSVMNKDQGDVPTSPIPGEESKSLTGHSTGGNSLFGVGTRAVGTHRSWWRRRTDIGSFHGSVLLGNLVRILVLFHLPITVFSVYQMVQHGPDVSHTSIALAALSFAIFSIIIPLHLVLRVTFTTTNKLYDETRTLLSLGPLYNHYRHGSQMFATLLFATNLAFGVTIGAGQKSGTAQAIIILVVEVVSALGTSVWLPWGSGASMGLISFLFCVARIVIAVLLVILTPTISIGPGPGGWVAYGILIILALVYLALLLMLLVKLIEALVRIVGGAGFDRSRHVIDAGLLGALGLIGCCGLRARSKKRRRKSKRIPNSTHTHGIPSTKINSDMASYKTPHSDTMVASLGAPPGPGYLGHDSRKGSTHSGPPPSVLRPEHALPRPYRENDNDEGFIMGAWQSYPLRHGYVPVAEPSTPNLTPPPPKSGFSRVGGGRSHIDTPYAIMDGTASARTTLHRTSMGAANANVFYDDDDPPPSLSSLSNVARQPEYGQLPPGAMQPAHVRTKSQTAIIEDASKLYGLAAANAGPGNTSAPQQTPLFSVSASDINNGDEDDDYDDDDDDDDSTVEQQPKKKPWYRIIRHRQSSNDGPPPPPPSSSSSAPTDADDSGGNGGLQQPTRSFVVIRKPQPHGMSQLQNATYPPSGP